YVAVLRKDLPSPLAPESDEEQAVKPEPPKTESQSKENPPKDNQPPAVKVDFETIGQRILGLPIPARNYTELKPGKEGVLYLVEGPLVEPINGPSTLEVQRFDLKTRKTDKLLENVQAFYISANGEKMLYRLVGAPQSGGSTPPPQSWSIAPVPPEPAPGASPAATPAAPPAAKALNLSTMEVRVDPPVEWRQMYHEAFR